jgi:hypothetical protein
MVLRSRARVFDARARLTISKSLQDLAKIAFPARLLPVIEISQAEAMDITETTLTAPHITNLLAPQHAIKTAIAKKRRTLNPRLHHPSKIPMNSSAKREIGKGF